MDYESSCTSNSDHAGPPLIAVFGFELGAEIGRPDWPRRLATGFLGHSILVAARTEAPERAGCHVEDAYRCVDTTTGPAVSGRLRGNRVCIVHYSGNGVSSAIRKQRVYSLFVRGVR